MVKAGMGKSRPPGSGLKEKMERAEGMAAPQKKSKEDQFRG